MMKVFSKKSAPPVSGSKKKNSDILQSNYSARPSNVDAVVPSDGAIWTERLAVVEDVTKDGNPRLNIRSYFRNSNTRERVWDEPPSGASAVVFCTQEDRKQAETKRNDLQFTLDLIPPDPSKQPTPTANSGGRFSLFKKKESKALRDESKDLNLQRAIAQSMMDQHGGAFSTNRDPRILFDSELSERQTPSVNDNFLLHQDNEDEDLAMAKALSLSETLVTPTEEEMVKLAIEQSQLDVQNDSAVSQDTPQLWPVHISPVADRVSTDKIGPFDPYSPHHSGDCSASSKSASSSVEDTNSIHKLGESKEREADRKARSLSRKIFSNRRRMEAEAGVL